MSAIPAEDPPSLEDALRLSLDTGEVPEGTLLVSADGEVNLLTASLLGEAVTAALARHPGQLIIDLAAVTFLDSTGLSVLAQAHTAASDDTRVCVVAPADGMPHRAMTLTGLDRMLAVFPTRADALNAH